MRTVFQLHTGIACQTHELLACQCHLDDYDPIAAQAEQDALDAVPDDASSPEKGGFCTASQFGIDSSPDVVSFFAFFRDDFLTWLMAYDTVQ